MNSGLQAQTKVAPTSSSAPAQGELLQRKCACGQHTIAGGACSSCSQDETVGLRRSAISNDSAVGSGNTVPPIVNAVLQSSGQPLDADTRAFMEMRFARDFGRVRVHTNAQANESARAVNALAYTVGHDVVFGIGRYSPQTNEGRRLMAHELTHVVQQEDSGHRVQSKLVLGKANDALELEADRNADRIVSGSNGAGGTQLLSTPTALQRACGPASIGTPPGCVRRSPTFIAGGSLFKFHKDCDDFAPATEETALAALPSTLPPTATVEIHGFASNDGDPGFNTNLSCARALKAHSVLTGPGGLSASRITGTFHHGGTPGPVVDRRSVVILPATVAAAPTVTTHRFRAAAWSFLSCAECNPFTDDGTLGVTPPVTEPATSSTFRQMHFVEAELGTQNGRTIAPGTARLGGSGRDVGISHFCGSGARAHIVSSGPPGAPSLISHPVHGEGVQFSSILSSRVGATVPPTLPGSPCGPLGTNPLIPVIGNAFTMRLFADGTKESEFNSATLYPSHFIYENGLIKLFGGSPVHPTQDFTAWASSTVPLAIGLVGFKALRFHCCNPTISHFACNTLCLGGFSVPNPLFFDSRLCAALGATVGASSCPTACAPAGAACTPIVRGSNP